MPWPPLPVELAEQSAAAFSALPVHPSRLQRQVANALRALGLSLQEEVRTAQGYSLDAVVCFEGCKVGVEVNGPTHYVGSTQKLTGATVLKQRQLCAFGWLLLVVPYWEWDGLTEHEEQLEYLRCRLHETVRTK